jgi:hypothetical protein
MAAAAAPAASIVALELTLRFAATTLWALALLSRRVTPIRLCHARGF